MPPHPDIFEGPSAYHEVCHQGLNRSGLEPQWYSSDFLNNSGINPRSGLATEFTLWIYCLHLLHTVDRLNGYQLAIAEHASRRVLQIRRAVQANPKSPDFDGLDFYIRHSSDRAGSMRTPAFDRHVMEVNKSEGKTMQQARLARDERNLDTNRRKKGSKDKDSE